MYHKKNVDFAYLLWEDFVYQVEHKDARKSNEMYYPRFTKVIIHFFMTKDPLIPRRNKMNWHYFRDDQMFTTIKLVSRHQKTQQFGAMLPIELTNEDIRNSAAYKEYYAIASGAAPPKTETSEHTIVRHKKKPATTHISQASGSGADEGTGSIPGDDDDQDDDDQDDNDDDDDDQDTDNDSDDFVHPKLSIHEEEAKDEESFDPIDVHTTQEFEDTPVTLTLVNPDGQQQSSSVSSQFVTSMLNPSPDAGIDSLFESTLRFAGAISSIPGIVERYMDQRMNEAVKTSYDVAAGLFEIELKKILIEKMESNKSIHRSDEQRNLYKSLVDAYECDKIIRDTYGDTVTLKRRRDDADKDEDPSTGSDRGSKIRRKGKEPESTSAPKEKATKTTNKSTEGSKSHQKTASESAPAEEPMQTTQNLEEPLHQEFKTCVADDQPIVEAS
nr:hypothetical protein [Tanacetum cinerariifolium]